MKNKKLKKLLCCFAVVLIVGCMFALPASAVVESDVAAEAVSAVGSAFSDVTSVFSVGSILKIIGIAVGACLGLVFMWWGLRKVISMVMGAFKKGKVSV